MMKIEIKNFQKNLDNDFEDYIQFHSKTDSSMEYIKTRLNEDLERINDSIFANINHSMIEKSKDDTIELTGFYYEKIMKWAGELSELKMYFSITEDNIPSIHIVKGCFLFYSKLLSNIELEYERYLDVRAKAKMFDKREIIFFHRLLEFHLKEKESIFFGVTRHPIEPILNQEIQFYKKEIDTLFSIKQIEHKNKAENFDKMTFLDEELEKCKNYIFDEDNEDECVTLISSSGEEIMLIKEFYLEYVLPYFEEKRDYIIAEMDSLDQSLGVIKRKKNADLLQLNLDRNGVLALFMMLKDNSIINFDNDAQLARFLENNTCYSEGRKMRNLKPQISRFRNGEVSFSVPAKKVMDRLIKMADSVCV